VHYLALTFSTLLSSQVSGAHRAEIFCSGLGQRPTICGLRSSSQIGSSWFVLLGSDFLLHHGRSEPAGLSAHVPCAPIRTSRWPVGSSGSAAEDQAILRVPHPAEASYTLRLRHGPVKLAGRVRKALNCIASGEACVFPVYTRSRQTLRRRSAARNRDSADRALAPSHDREAPVQ
jgi:hypothetical protein